MPLQEAVDLTRDYVMEASRHRSDETASRVEQQRRRGIRLVR